jgi:hypothetical protein
MNGWRRPVAVTSSGEVDDLARYSPDDDIAALQAQIATD